MQYTVKYGDKEMSWIEPECNELHKAKEVRLEYLLGQPE